MKLTKERINILKTFYKSDYVLLTLQDIRWTDKKSGEELQCYAYSANNSVTCKLPHGLTSRIDTGESYSDDGKLTHWVADMTPELYQIFLDDADDLETMYYHLDTNTLLTVAKVTAEQLAKAPQISAPQVSSNTF